MSFTPDGSLRVAYGLNPSGSSSGRLYTEQAGGAAPVVELLGVGKDPLGVYDEIGGDLKVLHHYPEPWGWETFADTPIYRQNGYWWTASERYPQINRLLADMRPGLAGVVVVVDSEWSVVTGPACAPSCFGGRDCGSDTCGGTCGSCSSSQSCEPEQGICE
jgi:hypothetical protein